MRRTAFAASALTLTALALGCGGPDPGPATAPAASPPAASSEAPELTGEIDRKLADRVSYGMGRNWGKNFDQEDFDVDLELLVQGITDVLEDREPPYTEAELEDAMNLFRRKLRVRRDERREALAPINAAEGAAYLAENRQREGVVELPSGLQYEVLAAGDGPKPQLEDIITVHYRGQLVDGTVFDDTWERDRPAQITPRGVIPGWVEALQMMPVGSRWRLVIPPELGYGERGSGQQVGPNATLIFEVELLSIEPRPER